jgi:dTDP-4-dehydrorhamnose reductase
MRRILVTGANGQVGWELRRALATLGEVQALDRAGLDLADSGQLRAVVRSLAPNLIVNAAAYTAVDKAESEPALAMAINSVAPAILAEECKRLGALLIHYSTDYVFDGTKSTPYTEQDIPCPANAYGRSKLAGEQAIQASACRHLILRTSWVYGLRGHNFLRTMMRLAAERDELRIVADQIGAPTWSRMIADATAQLAAQPSPPEGLFHMTAAGETSWHGFAAAILEMTSTARPKTPTAVPIPTAEYPLPAARPANSRLDCSQLQRTAGVRIPQWRDCLRLCLEG